MLPNRTNKKSIGPKRAPTPLISFQSPAPRALNKTSGSNKHSAKPAPSRADLAPDQPESKLRTAIPSANPETVSQLGILRVRQSRTAAVSVSSRARDQINSRFNKL